MFTAFILILALAISGIVVGLLVTPLIIEIDTRKSLYTLSLQGLVACSLLNEGDQLTARLKLPFYRHDFDLVQILMRKAQEPRLKKQREKQVRSRPKSKLKMTRDKAIRILKTFDVSDFYLNLDFENYMVNGMLYPLFHHLQLKGYRVYGNFVSQREMTFVIRSRLGKILWAIIF